MPSQLLHGALQQGELAAGGARGVQAGAEGQVAVGTSDQPHVLHGALQPKPPIKPGILSIPEMYAHHPGLLSERLSKFRDKRRSKVSSAEQGRLNTVSERCTASGRP